MRHLILLIKKDLQIEFRRLENIFVFGFLGLLFSILLSSGVQGASLPPPYVKRLFPSLLWAVFMVGSLIGIERSCESEENNRPFEALLLLGVAPSTIFINKALTIFFLNCICLGSACLSFGVLLRISIFPHFLQLLGISVLTMSAVSALASLVVSMTVSSKLKGVLFPIIMLPLLLPLFFASSELTTQLFLGSPQSPHWYGILVVCNILYYTLGLLLYKYTLGGT